MAIKKGDMEGESADNIIANFNSLPKGERVALIYHLINELKKIEGMDSSQSSEITIPIGIFDNDFLSSLEAIVKYTREERKLKFSMIAKLLNRSNKTIWATYSKSIKKMPSSLGNVSSKILIPLSHFSNRKFSTLENLVGFIKDIGYSNHEIGVMLHLDDRTIWTVYDRVKKKRGIKLGK